jgi:hypothetical protein
MKQIIIDLADKAIEDMPKIRWEIPDEFCEKFAKLIVQECAELAKHHVMNISTYGDAEFVEKQIKQHFGVEE